MSKLTPSNPIHTSPNGGVESEHSNYFRRMLSAGYKGHVQGMVGGATLYGSFGLIIGTIIGVPLGFATGGLGLWLIPVLGGIGAMEGAHTFADIGSHAAIAADSAETNEKRRLLLDHLRDATDPAEKAEITRQLAEQLESKPMKKLFHWKTLLIGAVLGGALALGAMWLAPAVVPEALTGLALKLGFASGVGEAFGFTATALSLGTAIGALAGGVIGIDREYVRRWLDTSDALVSSYETDNSAAIPEREIQRLSDMTPATRLPARDVALSTNHPITANHADTPQKTVAEIVNIGRAAEPHALQKQA